MTTQRTAWPTPGLNGLAAGVGEAPELAVLEEPVGVGRGRDQPPAGRAGLLKSIISRCRGDLAVESAAHSCKPCVTPCVSARDSDLWFRLSNHGRGSDCLKRKTFQGSYFALISR